MTDREAINIINQIQMQNAEVRHFDSMFESIEVAKEALQEREGRSKGCELCIDLEGNSLPARQDKMFCPKCGRPLK